MHKALDGNLTRQEERELEDLLCDPKARATFERLGRTHELLTHLPHVPLPESVAARTARDIALGSALRTAPPTVPSVAGSVAARIAREARARSVMEQDAFTHVEAALRALPRVAPQASIAPALAARIHREARHNPAPLLLVGGLVAAFVMLTASFAWPNLTVGATALRVLMTQLSPLVFLGFTLAILTSAVITLRPALPRVQRAGALAFAAAFALILPGLGGLFTGRSGQDVVKIGGNVHVNHTVPGNVIALGGNIVLGPNARVGGEAVAFLGNVRQARGARITGNATALLGEVEGARKGLSTKPLPALGTASAFQPLLSFLSGETWTRMYVGVLGALTMLLFLAGVAPQLARRQRHAPLRTLALGVLVFGLVLPPLVLGALSGFLVPAFVGAVLLTIALSVGLVVSLYDAGRALVHRLRLPQADVMGALIGLSAFAAALSVPPLAFAVWVLGGCWGAGTLLLARPALRTVPHE